MLMKTKFKKIFFIFFFLLLACFVGAVSASVDSSDNATNDLKFIAKEAKLNKNSLIQVQLLNSKNQTLENKTVHFQIYNKKSKKYQNIGKNITNSDGIAILSYKFKSYGRINVKSSVEGDNFEKSTKIFVPKAYLSIKNSYSKKKDGATLYSTIYNKGPKTTKFKIYYKFDDNFHFRSEPVKYKYTKPKAYIKGSKILKMKVSEKGKYLYVSGTIKKKGKIKIKWAFESGTDLLFIEPVVKSSSTKILGNNPLKIRITRFTPFPVEG